MVFNSIKKKNNPEQLIKNQILYWLEYQPKCMSWPNDTVGIFDVSKGIYRKKNSRFHRKGIADILGIWDKKPLAIEVKSKVGRASPEQKKFLADFEYHGGIAILARSLEDVVTILDPYQLAHFRKTP